MVFYFCAVLFCLLFSRIYGMFSHGVTSFYMTCLFLPPLVGGGVEGVLYFFSPRRFRRAADNLFHAGISTAGMAFLLQGIFEIAGTGSSYMTVFVTVSPLCLFGAAVCFCLPEKKKGEDAFSDGR